MSLFSIFYLSLFLSIIGLVSAEDFYDLLGVSADAETSQIKKAFR
jgi:hypothetical protein